MNILLIDDTEARYYFYKRIAKEHNLIIAATAGKAINALKEFMFDLILMDYNLNEYDKNETSESVAEYIRDNNIDSKIIITSANKGGVEKLKQIMQHNDCVVCDCISIVSRIKEFLK